eukprot:Gregarina_sp_Pseudo_9__2502@NODE_2780_length_877_cov_2_380668_g2544_i0_p1_GENE_NODE_2780_length_877_cov_2_380668_g2544_i0NODE_2780_length_877_cov_2_380668_g2544_i0_p1_ORF_typecomplete_len164_score12_82Fer4_19/PF06902_11/0_19_NODE_2780_length_877_cov_2_380668_g2544_i036527
MADFWKSLGSSLPNWSSQARAPMQKLLSDPHWRRRAIDQTDRSCPPLAFYFKIWADAPRCDFPGFDVSLLDAFDPDLRKWVAPNDDTNDECDETMERLRALFLGVTRFLPPFFEVGDRLVYQCDVFYPRDRKGNIGKYQAPIVFFGGNPGGLLWVKSTKWPAR